jgi:hypothetical protein
MPRKKISPRTPVPTVTRASGLVTLCLATTFSAIVFTTCVEKRSLPPPAEASQDNLGPVSDALQVDLYFDATLSMKGFVSTQAASSYQQTVPLLERGVIEGWNGGRATFHKFGDDIAPLPGRAYLEATRPAFYADSKYNTKTLIERVIDRAQPDHLTVIVSDLFQDNADVNQLSDKLKQKFVAEGLAVGVYAVRSQFAGSVYDVGPDNYTFAYKSGEKVQTYRPFYLLAFGKHADIARYFDVLGASGLSGFPESHVLILSRHLAAVPASFAGAKLKVADKISEISSSNLLSGAYKGDRVKAFKISRGRTEASLGLELQYDAALANVLAYGGELAAEVTAWKGEEAGAAELSLSENQEAQRAFRASARLLPEQPPFKTIDLRADLKVAELPGAGVYRYRVQLRPSRYALPEWVSGWNMRDEDIRAWHTRPQEFDGGKTYNLENFLGTLQGAVIGTARPKVCDVYFYVRVDR